MKKKSLFFISAAFLSFCLLTGCSKDSADDYVGTKITDLKEKDEKAFAPLIETAMEENPEAFILEFPEDLKTSYCEFLQDAFKAMDFEVQKAGKVKNGSCNVKIQYTPIDIAATTDTQNNSYAESLASADLTAEVTALLAMDAKTLKETPQFQDEHFTTLKVDETADGFSISDETLLQFLQTAMPGYMQPYNAICEILDARDYMQSYLDASFKGEVSQYAKHTGMTEEEATAWYEDGTFDPPEDLTDAYKERYSAAVRTILSQCQYTVGIPKKESGIFNYTIDVTTTPNNSIVNAYNQLEQGTYYSYDEVSAALVANLEAYAAAPAYGEETTYTISVNISSGLTSGEENSVYAQLISTILPFPE